MPVLHVSIERLHESPANPRRIASSRLDDLKRSLVADPLMLQARPVIALPDGTIVAGNMRYRAAVELGWTSIPCVTVDLDPERARLWMLRDNLGYGVWDERTLPEVLRELRDAEVPLDLTGFDQHELQRWLDDVERDISAQLGAMTYSILIDCESEHAQRDLASRLETEGLTVKLLMA